MGKKNPSGADNFRKKAEDILRKKMAEEQPPLPERDTVSLLHELRVHQIELELQNEELRQQRDRAEEALRKFSDLYSEIYDFTPVAYLSISREGLILESNLKASELLGKNRSQIIDRNFRNFLAEDNRKTFSEFLNEVYTKQVKVRLEIKVVKPDRSIRHCILEGTLSENENKCLAMITDISDLKELERRLIDTQEELKKSRDQAIFNLVELENIYRNVPAGLCVFDLDLHFLRINERLAEINGFPVQYHIGKHISEIVPALQETAENIVRKIRETGKPQRGIEFTGATPANPNEIRNWSEDWSPIIDHEGKIIGINVAVIETTAEKRATEELINNEKKLISAKEALEQSQEKLELTLRNAKVGTWEWDLESGNLKFDRRTEEIFGLKPGTFKETISAFGDLIHEDDLPAVKKAIENAVEGSPERTIYRTKPRNGKFNYISVSSIVIKDRNGNPKSLTGLFLISQT